MEKKFCSNCGSELQENARFCQKCGTPTSTRVDSSYQKEGEPKTNRKSLYALLAVVAALLLIICGAIYYSDFQENREIRQAREQFVKDSLEQVRQDSIKLAEQKEKERLEAERVEQEIQAKKEFLNKFYNNWTADENGSDYSYVKKHITANALKVLKDEYAYDCDGECLATWLFSYEAGTDGGRELSRTITEKDENNFIVEINNEYSIYRVLLTVIKVGNEYKIDNISEHSETSKHSEHY